MDIADLRALAASSEQTGRNVLLALHDLGALRNPDQDQLFWDLVDQFDHHPGLSCEIWHEREQIAVRIAEGVATDEDVASAAEIDRTYRLDGADMTDDELEDAAEKQASGVTMPWTQRLAIHNRNRAVALDALVRNRTKVTRTASTSCGLSMTYTHRHRDRGGSGRRAVRRAVRSGASPPGRPRPSGDDDPSPRDLAPSRLRLLLGPLRCWWDAHVWPSLVWRRLRREAEAAAQRQAA